MRKRRNSSGFTLVELIVAVLLGAIVLMGSFSIMTNMVTAEVNGMRTGTVTAWSMAGINSMNADIAGASALSYPAQGAQDNSLIVCEKWSSKTNPPQVMPGATGTMRVISYCWDMADAATTPFKYALLLYVKSYPVGAAVCPTAPLTCNQVNYSLGDNGSDTIVATGVYPDPAGDPIFTSDSNTPNAVRIRFVVGNPTGNQMSAGGSINPAGANTGTVTPVPVSVLFDTEIILED